MKYFHEKKFDKKSSDEMSEAFTDKLRDHMPIGKQFVHNHSVSTNKNKAKFYFLA